MGGAPPSLLPIVSPALLESFRQHPTLPRNTWYFVAATALLALNRPDEIPRVYGHVLARGSEPIAGAPGRDEQLRISRRIREALVKASAVAGLPKTINSLLALKAATPADLVDDPGADSPTGRRAEIYDTPASQMLQRGGRFFDAVYGKVSQRVMGQMERSGTEDLGLTARLMYGYLLSNAKVLSSAETSFVLIAGLIPQDVNPQLKGHLKGAINNGASVEEVRAVREVVIKICEASGMGMIENTTVGGWGWRNEVADL